LRLLRKGGARWRSNNVPVRLGTHIKLINALRDGREEEYASESSVRERVEVIKAKNEIYPLPKSPDPERVRSMSQKYNLYTNILHMKLGQFIMLEGQMRSNRPQDDIIASLVIRPKDEAEYDNEDSLKEEALTKQLLEEDVLDVHSVIITMLLNRDFILFTKFSGVIYNRVDVDEEEEAEEEQEKGQGLGEEEFSSQWFWYRIVRELAQGDIRRFNDIYDLKMGVVMVELSFLAQKAILENARNRAEEARQRALSRR
jgi:hypothetical protein